MTFPTQEHIEAAQTAADRVNAKMGFYCWPSATLAQALIESAGWTRLSGKNNGFGVKANSAQIASGQYTTRRTKEFIGGVQTEIVDKFADYASLADAYEAHAMLFVRVGVYKDGLKATSAKDFIKAIGPHYATAPTYTNTIINVMDRQNLYQYDKPTKADPDPGSIANAIPKPRTSWLGLLFSWLTGK